MREERGSRSVHMQDCHKNEQNENVLEILFIQVVGGERSR
jgi:hypothetical protein